MNKILITLACISCGYSAFASSDIIGTYNCSGRNVLKIVRTIDYQRFAAKINSSNITVDFEYNDAYEGNMLSGSPGDANYDHIGFIKMQPGRTLPFTLEFENPAQTIECTEKR